MIITALLIAGLSPDVKRNSYLEMSNSEFQDNFIENVEVINVPKSYLSFDNKTDRIDFRCIYDFVNISNIVKVNSINIINHLSAIFTSNLIKDNIFTSSYGTILIEFEKNNSIFSLEIGKESIGYFSEIEGNTIHFCEEIEINNYDFVSKLNTDFFDFYKRLN